LQEEITSINERIDNINITSLEDRVTALESQVSINRKAISDIHTAYRFQISGILQRLHKLEGCID
jgi:uncharacterized coiled-coil protein SlyX